MPPQNLSAAERETIITMNDDELTADVWTAQRRIITKLKDNPSATLVEEGHYGTTAWARFTMPRKNVSFRSATESTSKKRDLTDEERAAIGARLAAGRNSRNA